MVNTESLWEGKVGFDDLLISLNPYCQINNLDTSKVESVWSNYKERYPSSYNGNLVVLDSFECEEKFECGCELLTLYTSHIDYSSFITMIETKAPIQNYGILGTQCAIFSPDKKHILVGRRSKKQYYSPGLLTVPGGMVEQNDLQSPSNLRFLREIKEEVKISIKNVKISTLLREHKHYSSILFLTAELDQSFDETELFRGNSEWEGNKLFWLPIEELQKIPDDELMEGLTYLKKKSFPN